VNIHFDVGDDGAGEDCAGDDFTGKLTDVSTVSILQT
jgi:hypothetical protein